MFYLASGCEERVEEEFESRVTRLNIWKGARVQRMHVRQGWACGRTSGAQAHGQARCRCAGARRARGRCEGARQAHSRRTGARQAHRRCAGSVAGARARDRRMAGDCHYSPERTG
ncbi:hypothetical protein CRG98_007647 [Punica granatum]|uniref:Uncharacterized protein n=1 Tax=Punica granatum TaxID=22663 RepID=A0A2I0KU23_PUNGR|nr:hypothetical protein CRG98_007647 [Punica granatum]